MSLPLLAQVRDVEDRIGRVLEGPERTQCAARLRDASAIVRGFCKRSFTKAQTTVVLRPTGSTIKLPERPVISVDAVSLIGFSQERIPLPTFMWDGYDEIWIAAGPNEQVINMPESLYEIWAYRTPLCEVTYTHGDDVAPDDVVAVVAGMVVRTATTPGQGNISGETAGDYSYRVSFHAQLGPLALSDPEREALKNYRLSGRSTELRSS